MHVSTARGSTTPHDPALDGLRGFAVLLVFIFHFGGGLSFANPVIHALGKLVQAGWIGVAIFFALSGFLITGSLWDSLQTSNAQPHAIRNFYLRRALRILPLYYAVLLFVTVYALLHGAPLHMVRRFGLFAIFVQNLPVTWSRALVNPSPVPLYHLWSIAVEEQFYLIWPIVLLIGASNSHSARRGTLKLTLALFGGVVLFLAVAYGIPWIVPYRHHFDYFLVTQAGPLLLGSALALRMRSRGSQTHHELQRWALPALALGLGLYLLASLFSGTFYLDNPAQFILGLPGIALAAAALIPIALRPGRPRSVLSYAPLCFVGRISYGVYVFQLLLQPLIHRVVLRLVPLGHGALYFAVRFFVALALTLLTAWLSFQFLEQPFLNLKRHFPMRQPLP